MKSERVMAPATVWVGNPLILSSPVGGEMVLLDPQAGMYYSLNEVGARIWELLEEPISVAEICRTITEEYEVDEEVCRGDVTRVLGELLERGLAEAEPGGGMGLT